ncbi:metallophosphoesterase family protein [Lentibacillus sediminis]|uniref:metallophosphoesterase family protein n=1 Tax=Lentibacillus sediminis TaxID=1940529 RepID=UPI000C1C0D81|nr:metallophosphoesterase family protein [Lentibacillus sediminis]
MKVTVIADTHMPKMAKELPARLVQELNTTDLIIHAGDWNSIDVLQCLAAYAPVKGVYGNVDSEEIIEQFPEREILHISGHKIGVVHGHGTGKTTEKRALDAFSEDVVEMIIFGHSHIPMVKYVKKILLLNPGSPTDKRKLPYYSFAVLNIDKEIQAELIFYQEKSS